MTTQWEYLDLDLAIDAVDADHQVPGAHASGEGDYVARVVSSPAGMASSPFTFPLSAAELDLFRLSVGPPRITSRRLLPQAQPRHTARTYGSKLNDALFSGDVAACFDRSLVAADKEGKGLRLRLRLSGAPALDPVPWEYLWASRLGRFVALSAQTPVVRFFETALSTRTLKIEPPMRVLVMVSSPVDTPQLEVEKEVRLLQANTADLVQAGLLELVYEREATLSKLQHHLSYSTFHVFHFIGHGAFDPSAQEGVLLLERADGTAHRVKGSYIGTLLHDARSMQLAVINACEGARSSGQDAWSGVGQSLVRQGLPAVVAMQAEISDRAALAFTHEFYYALAQGFPVDAAVAEARKAIGGSEDDAEWGTPVLLQSATEQPFELLTTGGPVNAQDRWDRLYAEAEEAIAAGTPEVAHTILGMLMDDRPDDDATGTLAVHLATAGDAGVEVAGDGAPQPAGAAGGRQPAPAVPTSAGVLSGASTGAGPAAAADSPLAGLLGPPEAAGATLVAAPAAVRPQGGGGRGRAVVGGALAVAVAAAGYALWPRGGGPLPDQAASTPTAQVSGQTTPTTPPTTPAGSGAGTTATATSRTPVVVAVPFSAQGQVVDGQVDDWRGVPSVRSTHQIAPRPGGPTDISATWWLAWNEQALFVYTVVTDPVVTPVSGDPVKAFRGDSVSFEFGPDTTGLAATAALRSRDVHLILGLADRDGRVVAARNNSNGKVMAAGGEVPDVQAVSWTVDRGYAVEAAVPWSVLRTSSPSSGAKFGANLNVSDTVPSGSRQGALNVMVSSNPARVRQERPALWDQVRLDGPPASGQ